MATNNESKKSSAGTSPALILSIVSLCLNIILIVAVIFLVFQIASTSASIETLSGNVESLTEDVEDLADDVDDLSSDGSSSSSSYSFTDYNGDTVTLVEYDAYIIGEYICAGDASNWVITYDEDTEENLAVVTEEDGTDVGTFNLYFYATTDYSYLVCNLISVDDEEESYIYYVTSIVSDDDEETQVGIYFENATVEEDGFILYLPDTYEEYIAMIEEEEAATSDDEEDGADETDTDNSAEDDSAEDE